MFDVEVTPRAATQIERAVAWWEENRPAAPHAILDDFEEAKLLLSRQPGIGAKSTTPKYPDLRRLFLSTMKTPNPLFHRTGFAGSPSLAYFSWQDKRSNSISSSRQHERGTSSRRRPGSDSFVN